MAASRAASSRRRAWSEGLAFTLPTYRRLPTPAAVSPRARDDEVMTTYLITFPSNAMLLTAEEFERAGIDSHAVIEEAKAAGVYVFGGGIDEEVDLVLVSADGSAAAEIYPGEHLDGGFTVLEVPTREDAAERERSPRPAAARRSCASSCTTRPAESRTCEAGSREHERRPCRVVAPLRASG